jgi:energy-coupling factor transporter ATP-binding protein EcfA2
MINIRLSLNSGATRLPVSSEIIRIENLHYAYPGQTERVLNGIHLEIARGEFIGLMGATGAGKTTLCMALNGLVPHSTGGTLKGDVWVAGANNPISRNQSGVVNTKRTTVAELARHVGLVLQDAEAQLFNMTVEDEIAFGCESLGLPREEISARVEWALDVVKMQAQRARSPFQLSGGQKQRVAIAAILAMRPEVLILDEPTASLDPRGKFEVLGVIEELRRAGAMTIVLVEQDAEMIARYADRVIVLHQGRVALDAPPRVVFQQIEQMRAWGLDVPQVSELARIFQEREGREEFWINEAEAVDGLRRLC